MKILLTCLVLIATSLGCTTSEPLDPTGNWDTLLTWTIGDCHLTGAIPANMTVSRSATGMVIEGSQGHTVTGTALCSQTQCQLSFVESGRIDSDPRLDSLSIRADLVSNEDGEIIGSGEARFAFRDGTSCLQKFLASGHMNLGVVSQ